MDFRLIPDSLHDTEKTEYLLRDMPIHEIEQIAREALRHVDYGTRTTYKIELWVRDEYDKKGTIDYLKHIIKRGKLNYSDILNAFKRYNPFFELDPSRPIEWMDTLMKEKKKEEVFLTDDFDYVPIPKKIGITNPRWEHKDAEKKENSTQKASIDDTVILMADITGIPENGPVTFEIFDTSGKAPVKVGSAQGKNVGGVAKGDWVVTDKNDKGVDLKLEFQATAKSKVSVRAVIPIEPVAGLWFHIDLDNPLTDDDKIILRASDESDEQTIYMKDMHESKKDMVLLTFKGLKDGLTYDVIYDPGEEGEPYVFAAGLTKDFLLGKE